VKFAEIKFTANQVKGTVAPQGASKMEVSGQFGLHGMERGFMLPIDVQADGQKLQLSSHFVIPYVQWGVKNPSTFILRVSDKVTIDIHAVAHLVSP
jgi:polyisoprenoid-binding protein YceI